MRLRILGDHKRGFDGKLVAQFDDETKTHELHYDLENWKNPAESGFVGGNYIQVLTPEPMNLVFDQEYEFTLENARKVYAILYKHGWKPEQRIN